MRSHEVAHIISRPMNERIDFRQQPVSLDQAPNAIRPLVMIDGADPALIGGEALVEMEDLKSAARLSPPNTDLSPLNL